jgi:hypothetical protein
MNQTRKSPIDEEVDKNIGMFNLSVTTEIDKEALAMFKHIPNLIAFKTTLRQNGVVVGIGTGSSVLNQFNKFLGRTVRFAYNASLVDAFIRSTKISDALYIMPSVQKQNEVDIEGRDKQVFFGEEDLPQVATEKQLNFAKKLINSNCDDDEKEQYLEQISSPYFSKFECSLLIQKLMPVK